MIFCYYIEIVNTGFEIASTTSRYKKLFGVNGNTKTYGQWVHRCSGKLFTFNPN